MEGSECTLCGGFGVYFVWRVWNTVETLITNSVDGGNPAVLCPDRSLCI